MLPILAFLFIVIPSIEIAILIKIGTIIGFWPTLFLQLATGMLGAFLAKMEGLFIWRKIALELQSGRIPADSLINAFLIFAAGIILVTPGLLTDLAAYALLIPWTRNLFKRWLRKRFKKVVTGGAEKDYIDVSSRSDET
jgi:UPF0716 protein FxsA